MPKLINRNPKLSKLGKYAVVYYRGKIHYLGRHASNPSSDGTDTTIDGLPSERNLQDACRGHRYDARQWALVLRARFLQDCPTRWQNRVSPGQAGAGIDCSLPEKQDTRRSSVFTPDGNGRTKCRETSESQDENHSFAGGAERGKGCATEAIQRILQPQFVPAGYQACYRKRE